MEAARRNLFCDKICRNTQLGTHSRLGLGCRLLRWSRVIDCSPLKEHFTFKLLKTWQKFAICTKLTAAIIQNNWVHKVFESWNWEYLNLNRNIIASDRGESFLRSSQRCPRILKGHEQFPVSCSHVPPLKQTSVRQSTEKLQQNRIVNVHRCICCCMKFNNVHGAAWVVWIGWVVVVGCVGWVARVVVVGWVGWVAWLRSISHSWPLNPGSQRQKPVSTGSTPVNSNSCSVHSPRTHGSRSQLTESEREVDE